VEKCGKVWRQERGSAARHERQDTVYSIFVAAGADEMRACSACAGDYEDPDRTAWTADDAEDEEGEGAPCGAADEFPAEE
jgi:hypothetical protein